MTRTTVLCVSLILLFGGTLALRSLDVLGEGPPAAASPGTEIEAAYAALEAKLVAQLKDPAAWTDPKRGESTQKLVQVAGTIRSRAAVSILVEHLEWTLPGVHFVNAGSIDFVEPVPAALKNIGMSAVPALMEVLAGPPPDRATKADLETLTRTALACLMGIYEVGDRGTEMARYRLNLEAAKSTGPRKERLEQALKHIQPAPATK
jgi:hypothetical protein